MSCNASRSDLAILGEALDNKAPEQAAISRLNGALTSISMACSLVGCDKKARMEAFIKAEEDAARAHNVCRMLAARAEAKWRGRP